MKDNIKRAYESVTLSETEKSRMLRSIKARGSKKRYYWAAAAAVIAAAAVLTAVLLPGINKKEDNKTVLNIPESAVEDQTVLSAQNTQEGIAARITLSINPSVEFRLDKDGFVIEVVGTNEDGIELLEGMDAAGLSLENATILVVNRLIENGYISASLIEKQITLTVDSGEVQIDTLEVMSGVIKTAAGAYEIDVDVTEAEEINGVNIVLAAKPEEDQQLTEGESQQDTVTTDITKPEETRTIVIEYDFSEEWFQSIPDSVQLEASKEAEEVAWLKVPDDMKDSAWSVDYIGMTTKEAVLWSLCRLIDMGYVTDEKNILTEFRLSETNEQRIEELYKTASMLIKESGLMLEVWKIEDGIKIGLDDMLRDDVESAYTMCEILDATVVKDKEKITQQQMDILKYVYTNEEIEELLTPRYFIVMPNLIGLSEEKAIELIKEVGLIPEIWYRYDDSSDADTGTVTFQDLNAGEVWEEGQRCGIEIQAEKP